MDELSRRVAELVLQKIQKFPRARLLGIKPEIELPYTLVDEPPYEVLIAGSLTASELLFPPEELLQALLTGKQVLLYRASLPHLLHTETTPRLLLNRLREAEQQLYRWGVQPLELPKSGTLITAQRARQMQALGQCAPKGCRLTPLAREILEEKQL